MWISIPGIGRPIEPGLIWSPGPDCRDRAGLGLAVAVVDVHAQPVVPVLEDLGVQRLAG